MKIEGKELKIKTIHQPHGAWAGVNGKNVFINEKTVRELKSDELRAVLLHERGHFEWFNLVLTWVPVIIIFGLLVYLSIHENLLLNILFTDLPVFLTIFFIAFFISSLFVVSAALNLVVFWTKEIHADWYSVKRTKGDILGKTVKKVYGYNKKVTGSSFTRWYNGVILHPPLPLRLKIIKYMERKRDE